MISGSTADFLDCSICSERFKDPHVTNCGHTFCKPCISVWIQKKSDCPICRNPVKELSQNIVLRQLIESLAQKSENVVQPVIASLSQPIVPPQPKLPEPKLESNGPPLVVHLALYDTKARTISRYRMPQTTGNARAILEAQKSGTIPAAQATGREAQAKFQVLLLNPPIPFASILQAQGVDTKKLPTKTLSTLFALTFQDSVVKMFCDKGELVYRLPPRYLELYQQAQTPESLNAAINSVVLHILAQPSRFQITGIVSKAIPSEKVQADIQQLLKATLCDSNARFFDILELECDVDQSHKMIVGHSLDKPVSVPITLATTIDQLPQVVEMLKRKEG